MNHRAVLFDAHTRPRRTVGAKAIRLAFAAALATVGLVSPASPAMAADACATTFAAAFTAAAGGGTVTLTCDATIVAGDNLPLAVAAGGAVTLDLAGHTLTVTGNGGTGGYPAIAVPDGASLTIDDSSSPSTGTLIAETLDNVSAAIGGDSGPAGNITINAGTITATGGFYSAGIGGGNNGAGGHVTINGGTVTATGGPNSGAGIGGGGSGDGGTVIINNGDVTATGSAGAGIGGGAGSTADGGNGGSVTINGGTVTATSTSGAGIGSGHEYGSLGPDLDGGNLAITAPAEVTVSGDAGSAIGSQSDLGTVTNSGTLTLPAGQSIDLKGGTLTTSGTLANAGTISGTGTLAGTGTIDNSGAIRHTVSVGDDVKVLDHHYALTFDPSGGTLDWADATPWSIVYGSNLTAVGRTTADLPTATRTGYTFDGWFTTADGTGSPVADNTTLSSDSSDGTPVPVTLYAGWTSDAPTCTPATFGADFNGAADGDTVTLCGDVTIAADDHQALAVAAGKSITLDLDGHSLDVTGGTQVAGIGVPEGAALTITDPLGGGTLTATGGQYAAGIGSALGSGGEGFSAGDVTIDSGTVTATGGEKSAGIGAGYGGSGGAVIISGGTVNATGGDYGAGIGGNTNGPGGTVRITGGTVTASSVSNGAGIGSAYGGLGVDLAITSPAQVTVSGAGGIAIGGGYTLGTVTNSGTLTLPAGESIDLKNGTLTNDGTLANAGTINGTGSIEGTGTIDNAGAIAHTTTLGDGQTVTSHHYGLTFDPNGGALDWAGATPWNIVDGPSLASVGRTTTDLPTATRDAYTFDGWNPAADGSGDTITDSTTFSGSSSDGTPVPITLYAQWTSDAPACTPTSFAADFNGAADGSTVTLCGDLTIAATDNLPLAVTTGRSITLDLNGHTLDVTAADYHAGIQAASGASLTIKDSSTPSTGKLTATGGDLSAGIGGSRNQAGGTITVDTGTITANGGNNGAGIGGGLANAGTITINGGHVTATGDAQCRREQFGPCEGAGIGGGGGAGSGTITVNRGTVIATGNGSSAGIGGGGASGGQNGGSILITGGDVTATGGNASGFAGSGIGSAGGRTAGPVTITGGIVHATGGQGRNDDAGGAGIGTGGLGLTVTGDITISGGEVTATGGTLTDGTAGGGAGIGGGGCSPGPVVVISGTGTTVSATGKLGGAGIGGGDCSVAGEVGNGGDVTIGEGATVTATSDGGNAIGNGAGATGFGSLDNAGTIILASPLSIPADITVTNYGTITAATPVATRTPAFTAMVTAAAVTDVMIANAGTIRGTGNLAGASTIDNAGAIWHTITVGADVTVTEHHYQLSFDGNGGATDWGGSTPWSIVDGPTLGSVGRTTADLPAATRDRYTFTGWFLTAAATGDPIANTTAFSGSSSDGTPVAVKLYAGWDAIPAARVTVHAGNGQTAGAGTAFGTALSVTVTDAQGNPVAPGAEVTFTVTGGDASFGGKSAATASTDADGVAVAPTLTAGATAGTVTVEATAAGVDQPATFTETVRPKQGPTTPTTPTTQSTPPLDVTTAKLPDGTVGAPYNAALTGTGAADGSYHWSIAAGALPDGLQLSDGGVISGTPTKAGTFAFTVSVNDPATADLTIVVKPAAGTSPSGSSSSSADPAPTANPTTTPIPPPPPAADLPTTGLSGTLLPMGIVGLVLVLAGGLILLLSARRRGTGAHRATG